MKIYKWLLLLTLLVVQANSSYSETRLKVGVILSLTGVTAEYGYAIQNGIRLAEARFPEIRNQITFLFEDAEDDTRRAVSAFHKLTSVDKVNLVYVWGVSFCNALAPIAESRNVPLIGQCISRNLSKDRKYVIRFMGDAQQYMDQLVAYASSKGWKRLGMVIADNPYLEDMLDALKTSTGSDITVEIIDRYLSNQNDFRSTIMRLKNSNYDAIGVFLAAGQISQFYIQARDLRLGKSTFGTNFTDTYSEIELAKGSMEGTIFANNYVSPEFIKEYRNKFGSESQVQWAALSYEFAHHLWQSIAHEELNQPLAILNAFISLIPQPSGAVGGYKFISDLDKGRYFSFPLAMKIVRSNHTEFLGQE